MNLPQNRHGGGGRGGICTLLCLVCSMLSPQHPGQCLDPSAQEISWKVKYTGSLPNWLLFSDRKTSLACLTAVGRPFSKSPRCTKPENHLGRDVDPLFTEEEAKRTSLD